MPLDEGEKTPGEKTAGNPVAVAVMGDNTRIHNAPDAWQVGTRILGQEWSM
jgi:hypothetical protein